MIEEINVFILLRVIIFVILTMVPLILWQRHLYIRKGKSIIVITFFLAVVITLATVAYPIENVFYSFQTPQEAFEYRTRLKAEHVIYGQDSSMVFGRQENGTLAEFIVPKGKNGWKINMQTDLAVVYGIRPFDGFYITVQRFRSTEDYYVSIIDSTKGYKTIVDKNGTCYFKGYQDESSCTYYAYVYGFNMDYYIVIDDRMIQMEH